MNVYHKVFFSAEIFILHYLISNIFYKYKEFKKLIKISLELNKKYTLIIKERIYLYFKQNFVLILYFLIVLQINLYNLNYTDIAIFNEYAYLKNELMIFSFENLYYIYICLFLKKRLYKEKINFTQLFECRSICICSNRKFNIKYKITNNNKPIIILNPKFYFQKINKKKINNNSNFYLLGYS